MPTTRDQQLRDAIRDSLLIPLDFKIKLVQWMKTNPSDEQKKRVLGYFEEAENRKNDLMKKAMKREGNIAKFKHFIESKKEAERQRREFLDHEHDEVLLKAVEHELDEL